MTIRVLARWMPARGALAVLPVAARQQLRPARRRCRITPRKSHGDGRHAPGEPGRFRWRRQQWAYDDLHQDCQGHVPEAWLR